MARPKPDDELNFLNKYIIKESYFILKIIHKSSSKFTEILLSIEDLNKIKKHYWYYNPNEDKQITAIRTYYKDKEILISNFLFPDKKSNYKINHKNRNKFDFRRSNIIFEKAVIYRTPLKNKETETAIPGVFYFERVSLRNDKKYIYPCWVVCYRKDGMNKRKSFSINKYGFNKAKNLAEDKRREWEKEYNEDNY